MGGKRVKVLVNIVWGCGHDVPSWAPDSHHLPFVSYQMLAAEDERRIEDSSRAIGAVEKWTIAALLSSLASA